VCVACPLYIALSLIFIRKFRLQFFFMILATLFVFNSFPYTNLKFFKKMLNHLWLRFIICLCHSVRSMRHRMCGEEGGFSGGSRRRRREEGGAGANMRLMRVKYCSLNIESSHNFVIEYIHISLFYKHKLSFKCC
jgi:hypothetical protein